MKTIKSQPKLPSPSVPGVGSGEIAIAPGDFENFEVPPLTVVKKVKTRFHLIPPMPPVKFETEDLPMD